MGSVVTAIIMSLLFVGLSITIICAWSITSGGYLLRSWQNGNLDNITTIEQTNQTNTSQRFELFYQSVPQEAFITIVVISTTIATIASGLLLHLFAFHVYIKAIGKILLMNIISIWA